MIASEKHHISAKVLGYCITMAVVILMAVVITGCGAVTSNTVHVPVPVPCNIPDVPAPALPIDSVAKDADIFTIVRALWATVERQESYVLQLRTMLDGCRSVPANP